MKLLKLKTKGCLIHLSIFLTFPFIYLFSNLYTVTRVQKMYVEWLEQLEQEIEDYERYKDV